MSEELVPVVIVFIVIGLPIMAGTLISLAKILKGDSGKGKDKGKGRGDRDEAELVQEIHSLVTRLEKRIDALETIVIDKHPR